MTNKIFKESRVNKKGLKFSIIIPTWNNIDYLKLCIRSIQQNSYFGHQIIIFVNEGIDGTLNWIKTQKEIDYLHSKENLGICYAVNISVSLVKTDYVVYMNDDMYVCPDWDLELSKEIEKTGHNYFFLSGTLIEANASNNPNSPVIIKDYGTDTNNFAEERLLEEYKNLQKADWHGSSWPPSLVHKDIWDLVGGLSIEFSPGMYSDPDFSMKLWKLGVRIFKGVGRSKIYHFGAKSTKKVKRNKGSDTFVMKWGITARTFYTHYLKMGQEYSGYLSEPDLSLLCKARNKLKRVIKCF
ncbi:MAG: glycosyltransferase family 2 protein [Bacteroidales bacterium]|nr:glycosyltransferase family 2 protein [Bacteroidales bacterium]